jgi:nicotinamidase-related amidase
MSTVDLTFGPPGDQWHYIRDSKTYDLTRGAGPGDGFTMRTTAGLPDTSLRIAPNVSALVIIDMQNYFLDPSCRDHPTGLAAVEPTIKTIEKCRELGIQVSQLNLSRFRVLYSYISHLQVIWLNWGLTDNDLASMPASIQRGFSRTLITGEADPNSLPRSGLGADLGSGKGRCLMAGEWNSQLYGPLLEASRDEDIHCAKNRMSGMWSKDQPLRKLLSGESSAGKLRTLFFAGVNTDQCVQGTLTDAYNAGWDCVMIEDCCGTLTPGAREVCLRNMAVSIPSGHAMTGHC